MNKIWQAVNQTQSFDEWYELRLSGDQPRTHADWIEARDLALANQKAHAAKTKQKHLAALEGDRKASETDSERRLETELEPEKRRLQNQWLADHPGKTVDDFNKEAWHLLRANLLEERANAVKEATESQMRRENVTLQKESISKTKQAARF
jgi:hypothetical protein